MVGRRKWVVTIAVLAVGGALTASPAQGGPSDDKRRVDRQLAQAEAALETATSRARQAGTAFAQANQQLPGAQRALAQARGEVAAARVEANAAQQVARRARAQLKAAEATLTASERQLEAARDSLSDFVRASYQGAPYMATSAVLTAQSPEELIAGLNYLDNLAGAERRAVDAVVKARLIAAQKRAEVADRKRIADAAEAKAQGALDAARDQEATAAAAEQRVAQLVSQRKQALRVAQQERAASAAQYAELQAESRRIAAALREAARKAREAARKKGQQPRRPGTGGPSTGGGSPAAVLLMPVDGYKSSDFGYRYDPYYNVWQLHAGTDYAAPGGAPIRAADDGRVIRAGRNGGYGNYTCIYHGELRSGRGLSTCYAHQSRILVDVGDQVARGELIGRVGTTGASTGNHLHFEVRLDGEPVNPLRYL